MPNLLDKICTGSRNSFSFFLILVATFAAPMGCSKSTIKTQVEVFIVTRSGQSIKLGLVEVQILPYEVVTNVINRIARERSQALEDLSQRESAAESEFKKHSENREKNLTTAKKLRSETIRRLKNAVRDLEAAINGAVNAGETYAMWIRARIFRTQPYQSLPSAQQQVDDFESRLDLYTLREAATNLRKWPTLFANDQMRVSDKVTEILSRKVWNALAYHRTNVLNNAKALDDLITRSKELDEKIETLSSQPDTAFRERFRIERERLLDPLKFFKALPNPTITAKTDADGHCEFQLKKNQRWVVSAFAQREIPGVVTDHEQYVWIVALFEGTNESQKLLLSNDNLLRRGAKPLEF